MNLCCALENVGGRALDLYIAAHSGVFDLIIKGDCRAHAFDKLIR